MKTPLVSIIMPCYQCENTIEKTVRSVIKQECREWELIAVDDGSRDGSLMKLEQLSQICPKLHVIHQENQGVSSARNTGLRAAQGKWVFFLDADDLLTEDALSYLLSLDNGREQILCGAYDMHYLDEGGKTVHCPCAEGNLQNIMESLIRGDSALNSMCARLYDREFLLRNRITVPENIRIGEDVLFNLNAFSAAECWKISDYTVYSYEYGGSSAMTRIQSDYFKNNYPMIRQIDLFLRKKHLQTQLFRAHIDLYLRFLRRTYGKTACMYKLNGEMVNAILENVEVHELPFKQKIYWLILKFFPFMNIIIP